MVLVVSRTSVSLKYLIVSIVKMFISGGCSELAGLDKVCGVLEAQGIGMRSLVSCVFNYVQILSFDFLVTCVCNQLRPG